MVTRVGGVVRVTAPNHRKSSFFLRSVTKICCTLLKKMLTPPYVRCLEATTEHIHRVSMHVNVIMTISDRRGIFRDVERERNRKDKIQNICIVRTKYEIYGSIHGVPTTFWKVFFLNFFSLNMPVWSRKHTCLIL